MKASTSARRMMQPVGLLGLHSQMSLVRGPTAARTASEVVVEVAQRHDLHTGVHELGGLGVAAVGEVGDDDVVTRPRRRAAGGAG